MEKRTERMETKQANVEKNMETKLVNLEKNMETKLVNLVKNIDTRLKNTDTTVKNNTPIMETQMANVETKMVHMKTDIEGKLETVNNEVRGLKTPLVEAFDQMKDVLVKMGDNIKENPRKVRNATSGDRENIIVVGGYWHHPRSVEMCNWRRRAWSPLQSMPKKRCGATSFLYNNQVVIAGGWCDGTGYVDNTIRMNVDPPPDLSTRWSDCPIKLSAKMAYHSSVLYDDKLMLTGGYDGDATSDKIHEVQVVPSYTGKTIKNARTKTTSRYGDI